MNKAVATGTGREQASPSGYYRGAIYDGPDVTVNLL